MLEGLILTTPRIFRDSRGYFLESFKKEAFDVPFVQDNFSFSIQGTIRGLHFSNQAKLIRCFQGSIFDVALDLRPNSSTFGKWEAFLLDDEKHAQLFIPQGFAHGFCVLSETAKVHYKVSAYYDPEKEKSIRWDDPDLKIDWPIKDPILSERDRQSPFFRQHFYKEPAHALDHRR